MPYESAREFPTCHPIRLPASYPVIQFSCSNPSLINPPSSLEMYHHSPPTAHRCPSPDNFNTNKLTLQATVMCKYYWIRYTRCVHHQPDPERTVYCRDAEFFDDPGRCPDSEDYYRTEVGMCKYCLQKFNEMQRDKI